MKTCRLSIAARAKSLQLHAKNDEEEQPVDQRALALRSTVSSARALAREAPATIRATGRVSTALDSVEAAPHSTLAVAIAAVKQRQLRRGGT